MQPKIESCTLPLAFFPMQELQKLNSQRHCLSTPIKKFFLERSTSWMLGPVASSWERNPPMASLKSLEGWIRLLSTFRPPGLLFVTSSSSHQMGSSVFSSIAMVRIAVATAICIGREGW